MVRNFCVLTILLFTCGCASSFPLHVLPTNPKPAISVPQSHRSFSLLLDTNIQDDFEIPPNDPVRNSDVKGWRQSLTKGFRNAYSCCFVLSDENANSEIMLKLNKADLKFIPIGIKSGDLYIAAEIDYSAELYGSDQSNLGKSNGKVISKLTSPFRDDATWMASSAVEAMFEAITKDLFPSD